MKIQSFIVDAFTTRLFKGNPAAVCLLDSALSLSETQMLLIAKEFGFSETAFVSPLAANTYHIRYFSPKMEIPLCGHATLASAKVLFEMGITGNITFKTHSGLTLEIIKKAEEIAMSFPLSTLEVSSISKEILQGLMISEVESCFYNQEHNIILVEVAASKMLSQLSPDYGKLKSIKTDINGVLVTARSSIEAYDYEYRYFWPWAGTNEDPVTGAVQSFLAPYWSKKLGKEVMKAFQCSDRTGEMTVAIAKDQVIISSDAVIFSKGEITI